MQTDIVSIVIVFLDPADIISLAHTSRNMYYIAKSHPKWQQIYGTTVKNPLQFHAIYSKYGYLLGHWHCDYPFYLGGMIEFEIIDSTIMVKDKIIIDKVPHCLKCKNRVRFGFKKIDSESVDPTTGLWKFRIPDMIGSNNTLSASSVSVASQSLEQAEVDYSSSQLNLSNSCIVLECPGNCYSTMLRIRIDAIIHQYQFSKIRSVESSNNCKIAPGIWKGNYGVHDVEFCLVAYNNNFTKLSVTKITGDVHVPRGAVSFSTEFEQVGKSMFKGTGTIALHGYVNPIQIECNLLIENEKLFQLDWIGIRHPFKSKFQYYSAVH